MVREALGVVVEVPLEGLALEAVVAEGEAIGNVAKVTQSLREGSVILAQSVMDERNKKSDCQVCQIRSITDIKEQNRLF